MDVNEREIIFLSLSCGLLYIFIKAPSRWIKRPLIAPVGILLNIRFWDYEGKTLQEIAWFFTKGGICIWQRSGYSAFSAWRCSKRVWLVDRATVSGCSGSGQDHTGLVVITVGFLGYLVAGFPGACVSPLATFLPCYLFTVIMAPSFKKNAKNESMKAFVEGITASVIGALVGSVVVIGIRSIIDIPTALIAVSGILAKLTIKKVPEPLIIAIAAIIGVLIKTFNNFSY